MSTASLTGDTQSLLLEIEKDQGRHCPCAQGEQRGRQGHAQGGHHRSEGHGRGPGRRRTQGVDRVQAAVPFVRLNHIAAGALPGFGGLDRPCEGVRDDTEAR